MRAPALHCVHGEWITVYEAAERLGVAKKTLDDYRCLHRCTLEAAWDHYDALNRGEITRGKPGRKPRTYRMGLKRLTVKEAAEALGVPLGTMYRYLDRYNGNLNTCAAAIDARRTDRAVRELMRAIIKKGTRD